MTQDACIPVQSLITDENAGRSAVTRKWEFFNSAGQGIVRVGLQGLILTVAVRIYHASPLEKSLLGSAAHFGLLFTPLFMILLCSLRLTVSQARALLYACASVSMLYASFEQSFSAYFWGVGCAMAAITATATLTTDIWRQNVAALERGRMYSSVSMFGLAAGLLGSGTVTWWIDNDAGRYPPVLLGASLALAVCTVASLRIPSEELQPRSRNPLAGLVWLWRDRQFGYVSLSWMFLGLGNLAILPLRTEYLANPVYGLNYQERDILILLAIIPEGFRFLSIRFWGICFDRMNFIVMRIVLNSLFAISIVLFFVPSFELQVLSGICFGLAVGGGEIAWMLWVTKFATPERTSEYMSVHTSLTGLRGVVGPLVAFQLIGSYGMNTIAWGCFILVAIGTLMLLRIIDMGRRMRDQVIPLE